MKSPVGILDQPHSHIFADSANTFEMDIFAGVMGFYSRYLRPAVSRGCPSCPSCSLYMMESVRHMGLPIGLILGLERLLHEYGEMHHGILIEKDGQTLVFDPIENNTFWWRSHGLPEF